MLTDKIVKLKVGEELISTTPPHSFYVNKGIWLPAGKIKVGDIVWLKDGTKAKVSYASTFIEEHTVYNFSVSVNHNYYVTKKGVLVHNASSPEEEMMDIDNDLSPDKKAKPRSSAKSDAAYKKWLASKKNSWV